MEPDAAEQAALTRRRSAIDRMGKGAAFILLSPLLFFLSIAIAMLVDSFVPFMVGLCAATASGIAGAIKVVQGALQHVDASRELRRLDGRIPEARLLPQGHARR